MPNILLNINGFCNPFEELNLACHVTGKAEFSFYRFGNRVTTETLYAM